MTSPFTQAVSVYFCCSSIITNSVLFYGKLYGHPQREKSNEFQSQMVGAKDYTPGDVDMNQWGVISESPDGAHHPDKILSPI